MRYVYGFLYYTRTVGQHYVQMHCHCGRTVLMPPVPCGTRLRCPHPCTRSPPTCGHSRTPHACHDDNTPCPPCPFLTSKQCACGKKQVDNVRCSAEKVSCGKPCGKLLGCGFHRCAKLCHGDDCGTCTTVCGKPRKLW
jgi:transcriptional repressor NF-X1